MKQFENIIANLPEKHCTALKWFFRNSHTEQVWPKPLQDGTLLGSRAQGIYKPKWTKYALSIRQNIKSNYGDEETQIRTDGTWSFLYAKETNHPDSRDSDYANQSLLRCMHDRIPIGVMKQVREKPISRYQILGVALAVGYYEGYFIIEGFAADGKVRGLESIDELEVLASDQEKKVEVAGVFDPCNIVDAREKMLSSIVRRRGQSDFRQSLLTVYDGKCAITGCNALAALEAVHIMPYRGPQTNQISNGLVLRADLHILFDLGLIAIDTSTMTVQVSPRLRASEYSSLAGKPLRLPKMNVHAPDTKALDQHHAWSGL